MIMDCFVFINAKYYKTYDWNAQYVQEKVNHIEKIKLNLCEDEVRKIEEELFAMMISH